MKKKVLLNWPRRPAELNLGDGDDRFNSITRHQMKYADSDGLKISSWGHTKVVPT